jgi:hypothetical protein
MQFDINTDIEYFLAISDKDVPAPLTPAADFATLAIYTPARFLEAFSACSGTESS